MNKKLIRFIIVFSLIVTILLGCSMNDNEPFSSRKVPKVNMPKSALDLSSYKHEIIAYCWWPTVRELNQQLDESSSFIGLARGDGSEIVIIRHPGIMAGDIYKLGCMGSDKYELIFRAHRPVLSWRPGTNQLFISGGVSITPFSMHFIEYDGDGISEYSFVYYEPYIKYFDNIEWLQWDQEGEKFAAQASLSSHPLVGISRNIILFSPTKNKTKLITENKKFGNYVHSAVWSPDNKMLAIGLGEKTSGISIFNIEEGNSIQVSNLEYPEIVGWPNRMGSLLEIFVDSIFSNSTVFADYLMFSDPVWLHNGDEIVFNAPTEDDRVAMFSVSSTGENFNELFPELPGITGYPALSPNGKDLAFIRYPGWSNTNRVEILLYNFESKKLTSFVVLPEAKDGSRLYISGLSWTPDGQALTFSSNHEGQSNIYLISSDGQEWINFTEDMDGDAVYPAWKP